MINEAIRRREAELNNVIGDIRYELERVAARTVEKIHEMSAELANQLHPTVKNKNWVSLFTVTLTGDEDIPINKRGSGTRRLVLLNFFRAKAEETLLSREAPVLSTQSRSRKRASIPIIKSFCSMRSRTC